tara:strand:- start:1115 stop:1525 length:411 start_codon:yes stop_codon:yes gene_type:complete
MNNNNILNIDERYCNGVIYCIYSKSSKLIYIGSTIQGIKKRLIKHKTDMNGYLGLLPKPRTYRSSFEVLLHDDYEIIELEKYNCNNRNELERREALWILKLSKDFNVVNKLMPSKININDFEFVNTNLTIPEVLVF